MSATLAALGNNLLEVMPGSVLTSKHQGQPSASKMKSVRE